MTSNLRRPFIKSCTYIQHRFFRQFIKQPILPKIGFCSLVLVKKTESKAPTYTKTDHEYKITKKATIQTLENLLGVKTFNALEIISKNKSLLKVASATMKSNHALFLQKFITNETLLKYPELLAVTNAEVKFKEIQKLPYNINVVAILLLIPLNTLTKLVESELNENLNKSRIKMLTTLLQVSEEKACEFMAKKSFLCSLSSEKIGANIKLLIEFGINPEEISNDLWVLRYSNEVIKNRLNVAKEHNIDTMKTWMVRAQPEIFQHYIQRRSDNKSILGNSSLAEYLSERLECSVEIANYLIIKQPALKNKSLKKLKELIDFLFAEGFKPNHICRVPKILVHSVETTRKRLKQLEDKDIQIDSLHMLTKSQKQFRQYYEVLLKNKNKLKK